MPLTTRAKVVVPSNRQRLPRALSYPMSKLNLRGLDTTSPYDVVKDSHTPFGHDFRIYSEDTTERHVSISSRKGSGEYVTALSETIDQSNTSTTGAADQSIGVESSIKAMKFVAGTTGPLTRIDLRIKKTSASSGPVIVKIYTDNAGSPGVLVGESGILNSDITTSYTYVPVNFIEAPTVTSTSTYWIVAYIQDDGSGTYLWSSNTSTTLALTSDSIGSSWSMATYSLNFKTYVSSTAAIKGGVRYAPANSSNKTVIPIGTSVYIADDNTGALSAILTGQSSSASNYYFTHADDKLFWVNGFNDLTTWNGTVVGDNPDLVINGAFETNVAGWTGGTSNTLTQSAAQFHSGANSMSIVSTGGNPASATYAITLEKGKQYTLSAYVKGTVGQAVSPTAQGVSGPSVTLTGGWDHLTYTFVATASTATTYGVLGNTNDTTIYVDDFTLHFTGIQTITHAQLPILSHVTFHKNLLVGISASDTNKIIWSEAPGNDDGAGNFWYNAYLSTSFIYIPAPKPGDPLTAMVEFQDNLYFFTRSSKYALYGSDPSSFILREAAGSKGTISQNTICADENSIYFVAPDGIYSFTGSRDQILSTFVQNIFESIADLNKMFVTRWNRVIRFYYPSSGSPVNDSCLLWHTSYLEWMMDTDSYVSYAIPYTDGDDDDKLAELSSVCPRATYAEQDYNNLGKAIDFLYYCKNDSFGIPAMRKRLYRFFPLLEGDGRDYPVQVGVDKDMQNANTYTDYSLVKGVARIGEFLVGDGTLITTQSQFKPKKFRISGYAYYWQVRVKRRAINNKVRFIGYVLAIRTKRL